MTGVLIAGAVFVFALVCAALGAMLERAAARQRPRGVSGYSAMAMLEPDGPKRKLWDPREEIHFEWPFEPRRRDRA